MTRAAQPLPASLHGHRISGADLAADLASVAEGAVVYAPARSLWFIGMAGTSLIGGWYFFSWGGLAVFFLSTGAVLLFGHSLGSHRKLIHDSFACPKWLEYFLVYMGVQVGLAGPLGLLKAHDLRDFAQRLPDCHPYLRHGSTFWRDAWWQIHCDLRLARPPRIAIEDRVARDSFYRFLEATWMWQQLPPALLLYALGGWSFVVFGTCARVTAGVFGHWLIGYFAHNEGGMHFRVEGAAVQGRNIRLVSLLTMGECWHNNHHAYPGSARLGLFPGEWDPGWWMLMILKRLGLVSHLRLPEDLAFRAELKPADALGVQIAASSRNEAAGDTPSLAGLFHLLRQDHAGAHLVWPESVLGEGAMRRLVGIGISLAIDPMRERLVLAVGGRRYLGLPAICLAVATRGGVARFLTACLLPFAVAFERLRQGFARQAA